MDEKPKDQFFFQGKFFDTLEELFEYEKKWRKEPLDQETCERILKTLQKDITMNIFMRGEEFTNGEFLKYVEDIFNFAISCLICREK